MSQQLQQTIKYNFTNEEDKARYIQKMKYCMISFNKSNASRNNLLMFVMENKS